MPFKCPNLETDDSDINDIFSIRLKLIIVATILIFYILGEYILYPQHNHSLSRKILCTVSGCPIIPIHPNFNDNFSLKLNFITFKKFIVLKLDLMWDKLYHRKHKDTNSKSSFI